MFTTIILFLGVLGILIFVHEAGHFITARRNGITCHEFGFGFPPRLIGFYRPRGSKKWKTIIGNKEYTGDKTLYSINLIPLGGFVRIKGEDGTDKDPDSFAVQSHWVRFKVLIAGVMMNFVLAWIFISISLMIGTPTVAQQVTQKQYITSQQRVQINNVQDDSPAKKMGITLGDVLTKICTSDNACVAITTNDDVVTFVRAHGGEEIAVSLMRHNTPMILHGRLQNTTQDHGGLGVSLAETVVVKYPWYLALWEGLMRTVTMIIAICAALIGLLRGLVTGAGVDGDITGPIGIAQMTGQMRDLGVAWFLNFVAMLSINLGIINALPIPALDGGRILFLLIEKIKGKPVNQKVEGYIHGISFMLLIILMLVITARDILKFF